MNQLLEKRYMLSVAIAITCVFGAYYYIGTLKNGCQYTEVEIPLTSEIAEAKIVLASQGASLLIGEDSEYLCLKEMGTIKHKLVEPASATNFSHQIKDLKIDHVNPNSNLEFTAVKLMSITKHGIGTIDSGKGPIEHLILKDQNGKLYDVAIVYLGFSEFLKAKVKDNEITLRPETILKKYRAN